MFTFVNSVFTFLHLLNNMCKAGSSWMENILILGKVIFLSKRVAASLGVRSQVCTFREQQNLKT